MKLNSSLSPESKLDLAHLPPDDPAVYRMLQQADTVGVFQVESRAQMATLPRLQARALLRSRRRGRDHPARADRRQHGASVSGAPARRRAGDLRASAARAGAQAHARRAAVSGAAAAHGDGRRRIHRRGSGGAAARDGLQAIGEAHAADRDAAARRAWRRTASRARPPTRSCCRSRRSRSTDFPSRTRRASRCSSMRARISRRISRRRSTRRCSTTSRWGSTHPATLVKDAQRHGVRFAPIDVQVSRLELRRAGGRRRSGWGCGTCRGCAMRRGSGSRRQRAGRGAATGECSGFASLDDLVARAGLRQDEVRTLAEIGALASFGGDRRTALWQAERAGRPAGPLLDGRQIGTAMARRRSDPAILERRAPDRRARRLCRPCPLPTASAPTTTARG